MGTRLDVRLVESGHAKSRERAKQMILSGGVFVNGKKIDKPSYAVTEDDEIKVTAEELKYVGRGGLKLEKALSVFNLDVSGCVCIDLGASTGGFCDCLLQNGAARVYAVDVGHGQLDSKLIKDARVINLEGVNVKSFSTAFTGEKADFVCADLSFISVKNAIAILPQILKDNARAVILIKPQFEAGRKNIGKGGIVRDKKAHIAVLADIASCVDNTGLTFAAVDFSAIRGGDGNIEYIALLENKRSSTPLPDESFFAGLVGRAFDEL